MGKQLTVFSMTIHTGDLGWMNRFGPHHDPGLRNVTMETNPRIGHQEMARQKSNEHTQNKGSRKKTKEEPFFPDEIHDDLFQKVSDSHGIDPPPSLEVVPQPLRSSSKRPVYPSRLAPLRQDRTVQGSPHWGLPSTSSLPTRAAECPGPGF